MDNYIILNKTTTNKSVIALLLQSTKRKNG